MLIKGGNCLLKKPIVVYVRKFHLTCCASSINRQRQAEGKSDTEEDEDSDDASSSMSEEVDGDVEGKLWIGVGILC